MRSSLRRHLSSLAIAALGAGLLSSPAMAEPAPTPPLVSLSVAPGPYGPGDVVEFDVSVEDPSELTTLEIIFAESDSARRDQFAPIWHSFPASGSGKLAYTIPDGRDTMPLSGVTYRIREVRAQGAAGAWANYFPDGSMWSQFVPGMTHDIDLSSELTFVGSSRDHTPPTLRHLSFSSHDVERGQPVTLSYEAADANLRRIHVWGLDVGRTLMTLGTTTGQPAPSTGTIRWVPNSAMTAQVFRVDVEDSYGNMAIYYPDGRLTSGTTASPGNVVTTHAIDLPDPVVVRPPMPVRLTAEGRAQSVTLRWSQNPYAAHKVVVSPGGQVFDGANWSGADRVVDVRGLTNGVAYTFTVTTSEQGVDSRPLNASATPRMSPVRVFGTGDRSRDGRADLWAAPSIPAGQTSSETWLTYQGAGGGKFKGTLNSTIPVTHAPLPGSSTGRGPGASMGALHLDGGNLVEPTATGSKVVGKGFGIFRTIDASSDLTADGIADLFGITPAGDFFVYPSTTTGAIGRGVRLGGGWGSFQSVFSPGDFNGDKRSDIVAVDGLGKLWLYPGNGRAGFGARVLIGAGWASLGSVFPMRDFSGDGRVDIGAITVDGKLRMYPGNGRGGFLASSQIGTGWGVFL